MSLFLRHRPVYANVLRLGMVEQEDIPNPVVVAPTDETFGSGVIRERHFAKRVQDGHEALQVVDLDHEKGVMPTDRPPHAPQDLAPLTFHVVVDRIPADGQVVEAPDVDLQAIKPEVAGVGAALISQPCDDVGLVELRGAKVAAGLAFERLGFGTWGGTCRAALAWPMDAVLEPVAEATLDERKGQVRVWCWARRRRS